MMRGVAGSQAALVVAFVAVGCDGNGSGDDAGTDGVSCVPLTGGGECNAIEQCGCGADWCRWMLDVGACTLYEGCSAGVTGTLFAGEACDEAWIIPDPPWCSPGHVCLRATGDEQGTCRRLCVSNGDCEADGTSCVSPASVAFDPHDPHGCTPAGTDIPFTICM